MQMKCDYTIIIPAHLRSQRLPRKVLRTICGKTLLEHAFLQAKKSQATNIYIATDSDEIAETANNFAAKVVLTPPAQNGTERLAYACDTLGITGSEIIVNLQGDILSIPNNYLDKAAATLALQERAHMATLVKPIAKQDELTNPNVVKAVLNCYNEVLYFSRAPIYYSQKNSKLQHWRHVGVYAYRADFLSEYVNLQPSELEAAESLEQLRALYYGYSIVAAQVAGTMHDINTAQDLELALVNEP